MLATTYRYAIRLLNEKGFAVDEDDELFNHLAFRKGVKKAESIVLWYVLYRVTEEEQPLSVRRAFYRAVSAQVFPDTSDPYYDRVGSALVHMRRTGVIPYEWISDSTRITVQDPAWSSLEEYLEDVRNGYKRDYWQDQPKHVEIMTEKDALSAVLAEVTRDQFNVPLRIIRGNSSETYLNKIAERWQDLEKPIYVFYLGDHDPAGLDIERDAIERRYH